MILSPPNKYIVTDDYHININNTTLDRICERSTENAVKFLGIHIDEHLTWKSHINHIRMKINKTLFVINQLKHFLPKSTLLNLYNALIQPHISYGIQIWGNAKSLHLNKLEKLQKRAIRTVNQATFKSHTEPLFKSSAVLKISDMFIYQVLLFMRDYNADQLPECFCNMYIKNRYIRSERITRQSELLYIPQCKTKFVENLPYALYPKIWNNWLGNIAVNQSRLAFKRHLKLYMLEKYQSSIKCNYKKCRDCKPDCR